MRLDTCPRCSTRMGLPLKSGRQVCPHCGWATAPAPPSGLPDPTPPAVPAKGGGGLVQLCWRILRRGFLYLRELIQQQFSQWRQTAKNRSSQPRQLMSGLRQRLVTLEQSIPVGTTEWLTPEAAFQRLGGNPQDPSSVVASLDGMRSLSLARFQALRTAAEFQDFGLEMHPGRRKSGQPWLRLR